MQLLQYLLIITKQMVHIVIENHYPDPQIPYGTSIFSVYLLYSRNFSLTSLSVVDNNNSVMAESDRDCACVYVCIQTHAQVSETSSARYLCLSLKAITSLPLLAKTTRAGWVLPSSLTNLSAWRASREGERGRGKFLRGFISQEGSSSSSRSVRGHTYHKFHKSGKQRKL